MEFRSNEYVNQQTRNFSGKKYRKSIVQIEKIIEKNQLFQCSFIYELLILQQKCLVKLLNKNIFKKQPYSLQKTNYIVNLVSRNNSILLYIASMSIEQESNFTLKEPPKIFETTNPRAQEIIEKIVDCKNLTHPIYLFFQIFLLSAIACINTLKKYDAYQQAYQTAKFCYQITFSFTFPNNLTIQKRIIQIKMIYGAMLFQLGQYQYVKTIQDQVIDSLVNILCSDFYIRYKQNQKKKLVGEMLWRKLLVSIMVNLSASIHSKNYHNICQLYQLFASAVRDFGRSQSMIFRKCINYVLDSIGVIVHEYNDVMDEIKGIVKHLFYKLESVVEERHQQLMNGNAFKWKEIDDDYYEQQEGDEGRDLEIIALNKSKSFYAPKQLSLLDKTINDSKDSLNTRNAKNRTKLLKGFMEKDSTFNAPSTWKNNDFFKNKDTALNYLSSISLHHHKPAKEKNAKKLNRKGQFIRNDIKIEDQEKEKEKETEKEKEKEKENIKTKDKKKEEQTQHVRENLLKKQNQQYSKIIKRQFQLKYRQSSLIKTNQQQFVNIPQMKRNIKQTDKFIKLSLADKNDPLHLNSSCYFDNDDVHKQQGVMLFVETILKHKDFLGIPKLFQKHEMIKRKMENIHRKKIQKKHKSMSSRRTSKFQNAQLSNLLRGSFTTYVSNPRSKKPMNIRDSVGVIVNSKIPQSRFFNRKPMTNFAKQHEYADKVKKLVDHCYGKSQQIIKKFSNEIEADRRLEQTPKQKSLATVTPKSEWELSHKFYKLGKTIMNNTFSTEQKENY